jgi:hypothetical protein
MMTPRQDLLDHAVDLFPAPEGSAAEVRRAVARRHRNRRLGAAAVAIAIWVAIGVAALTFERDDADPRRSPTPSPTVAPGTFGSAYWPGEGPNSKGLYSWDPWSCGGGCGSRDWMQHTGFAPGSVSIHLDGVPGITQPHEGASVTIFGYEGSHQADIPGGLFGGIPEEGGPVRVEPASCERWMVDIQGTTVTISLCATPGASVDTIEEAHEIIESIQIESRDPDPGFLVVFTLATNKWAAYHSTDGNA